MEDSMTRRNVTEERPHNERLDVWAVLAALAVAGLTAGILVARWRLDWDFHWAWIAVPGVALIGLIYLGYKVRARTHAWWPLFLLIGVIIGLVIGAVLGIRRYETSLREEGAADYKAGLQQALADGQLGKYDPAIAQVFNSAVAKEISPERAAAEAAVWVEVVAAITEGRPLDDPIAQAALESLLAAKDAEAAAELTAALATAVSEQETAVDEAQAEAFERAIQVAFGEIPEDDLSSQERLFLRALQAARIVVPSTQP